MYSSSNEDNSSSCYYDSDSTDIDDGYYEEYVSKHVKIVFSKFGNIENPLLKYLIIIWYLLDIISLTPQYIVEYVITEENEEFHDFFSSLIKEYKISNCCCFEYKLHNIKLHLKETHEIEMELSNYLRAPLDNSFLLGLKEIMWHYKNHKTICKKSVESFFKCLSRTITY